MKKWALSRTFLPNMKITLRHNLLIISVIQIKSRITTVVLKKILYLHLEKIRDAGFYIPQSEDVLLEVRFLSMFDALLNVTPTLRH